MSGFYVTRQSNYYDEGAYSVEIARELDYAGPGALVQKYPGEFEEYNDPREAAEAAIRIARAWRADKGLIDVPYELFTLAMNDMVYATVNDAMTSGELREWAQRVYDNMPKCRHCGDIVNSRALWYPMDFVGEEEFACCSENCADLEAWEMAVPGDYRMD
jgi:hypothetical protein